MLSLLCTVRTCHLPLAQEPGRYVCANRHSFDIARSGYINLLQPQDRRSKMPGDTPVAVAARRRFVDAGHVETLVEAIVRALPLNEGDALLDAGCGEGHHAAAFRQRYGVEAWGVDISVPAIELAARRYATSHWVVANADRFLPFEEASFAAVTSITARLIPDEFRRVIRQDGTLLLAIAAPDDLIELRASVLGDGVERDRVERTLSMFEPQFQLQNHERIRHVARLDRQAIHDVMSSSYRGLRTRERERLDALAAMDVAMDVTLSRDLLTFRPR